MTETYDDGVGWEEKVNCRTFHRLTSIFIFIFWERALTERAKTHIKALRVRQVNRNMEGKTLRWIWLAEFPFSSARLCAFFSLSRLSEIRINVYDLTNVSDVLIRAINMEVLYFLQINTRVNHMQKFFSLSHTEMLQLLRYLCGEKNLLLDLSSLFLITIKKCKAHAEF